MIDLLWYNYVILNDMWDGKNMGTILSGYGLEFMDIIKYPTIDIQEKKMNFIIGESGCGKSTLLKIINKTVIPSKGTILYREENVYNICSLKYRRKVLLASQDAFLFDGTIKQNFQEYYMYRNEHIISDERILELLSTCLINFSLDTKCSTLSGGERQRVFIAICISFVPDILLLDEPTSALDEKTSRHLILNIKDYCITNGITPVLVCHNDKLVKEFSDYTICLQRGDK